MTRMVSVVENWARLEGTVREVRPDPELPDRLVAVVDVDAVEPVEDDEGKPFPNLFADAAGRSVELQVPAAPASGHDLAPGRRISARVKRTGPNRSFVHPRHLSVR
jgi:hypothetical protein